MLRLTVGTGVLLSSSAAALVAALLTIPLSAMLKFLPSWTSGGFPDYPFLDRMSIVFVFLIGLMIALSLLDPRGKEQPRLIQIDPSQFRFSPTFAVGSALILGILAALYTVFW